MTTPNTQSASSFWKRPEGNAGKALIFGALGIGAYLLIHFQVVQALILLAENTLYLGILGVALALFWWLVTSERVRALLFYGFQMISRSIASMFVDIDPIAILKSFAQQMRKKGEEVDESIAGVMGAGRALDMEITRNQKELDTSAKLANVAQDEDSLNFQLERAGRRNKNLAEYTEMKQVITEILAQLNRVKKRVDYHINNSEDEMNELIQKNRIAPTVGKGVSSAKSVFGKSSEMFEIKNMAADSINRKYTNARGELDGLIQIGKGIDSEIDLSQLAFRADGQAKLAELRKKLNQVEGAQTLPAARATARIIGPGDAQPVQQQDGGNRWAQRLKRGDQ